MTIVPALLTGKREELLRMLSVCEGFTDFVQIDIMDGIFVPSRSITVEEVKSVSSRLRSEAHLMVRDPLRWLEAFNRFGAERIIYHFEASTGHKKIISQCSKTIIGSSHS